MQHHRQRRGGKQEEGVECKYRDFLPFFFFFFPSLFREGKYVGNHSREQRTRSNLTTRDSSLTDNLVALRLLFSRLLVK